MERTARLSPRDRDYFLKVSRAAFANPFSEEREELDRQLAGVGPRGTREANLRRAIAQVREKVSRLERGGGALDAYCGEERGLMERVFLFEAFHAHMDNFDALIREQARAGDAPCAVPFAADALARLSSRGFPAEVARRYFAFFYQLRRGFFLVEQGLVGRCPSMRELRKQLWQNVFTHDTALYGLHLWDRMEDFSALLLGETGTGKGAAAAAIGRSGFVPFDEKKGCFAESFARNFIALNLSQFPESLIESELFGHRRGAFTGAIEHHEGVFARCTPHGAIFLDEVGDTSIPVQIKLLQVLQERVFSPVGSHERLRFRGRVIAATNRPLDAYRREGRFRDDLYYRLCSDIVTVPTLRQRVAEDPAELGLLVGHLVVRTVGGPAPELAALVQEVLRRDLPPDYAWPGNVRELEQAVRRVILTRAFRGDAAAAGSEGAVVAAVKAAELDARGLLQAYCRLLHERYGTYEEVARRTGLDRRTVRKHILGASARGSSRRSAPCD